MHHRLVAALVAALVLVPAASAAASSDGVVISQLRVRGPAGGNDEFVELANTSRAAVDVSGWRLVGCSATGPSGTRATLPPDLSLPAGAHYLLANTASGGYSGSVAPNLTYSTGISDTGGAQLTNADGTVIDAVGSDSTSPDCREGAGLPFPTTNADTGFERRASGTQDTDDNVADFAVQAPSTPQACGPADCAPPPCGEGGVIPIHEIQGSGAASACVGRTVTVSGIVTGIDDLVGSTFDETFRTEAGIWIQDQHPDDDPSTSEGIFIAGINGRSASMIGDDVTITGKVAEGFDGLTEIVPAGVTDANDVPLSSAGTVDSTGNPLPAPVVIDPAKAAAQDATTLPYYESLEGMRVELQQGVADSGGTDKFNELYLLPGHTRKRLLRADGTNPALLGVAPDAGAGNPVNPNLPWSSTTEVKADLFDYVDDVVGPLTPVFGYMVMPQPGLAPKVTKGPIAYPPTVPKQPKKTLRLTSFNVENFFPPGATDDGHTYTEAEYEAKRDAIADAIDGFLGRPDVIGMQEVAYFPDRLNQLQDLANILGGYKAYVLQSNDARGIAPAFLIKKGVKVSNLRQFGRAEQYDGPGGMFACGDNPGETQLFNRPPLALDISEGKLKFTYVTNHWASQSHPESCREAQANYLHGVVEGLESAGDNVIVGGDLNDFEDSPALADLVAPGVSLSDLWSKAPADDRYSYSFDGYLQTLDHVLVTSGLSKDVEDMRYVHFDNDYYQRTPTDGSKVSDHDPPLVTLSTAGAKK